MNYLDVFFALSDSDNPDGRGDSGPSFVPGSAEHIAILANHCTELLCQQGEHEATILAWEEAKREAHHFGIWSVVLSVVFAGRQPTTLVA